MTLLRSLWAALMAVSHFIGRVMTVILLTVIFVVVVVPLGALLWAIGRSPLYAGQPEGTTWRRRPASPSDIEEAAKPF